MAEVLEDPESVRLIVLHNPKDELPIRSITRSPKEPGMWQMQTFDADKNPSWDEQHKDLRDALIGQMKRGFKIKQVIR